MDEAEKQLYSDAYDVYKLCFPHIAMTRGIFLDICDKEQLHFVHVKRDGRLAAFALEHENIIRIICVHPDYQRSKLGHMVLMMCEGAAAGKGYKNVIIGGDDSPLFMIGAADGAKGFFEKQGGKFSDCYYEMKLDLSGFENSFNSPDGIKFDYYKGSPEKLRSAVAAVDDEWIQFFSDETPVYCGFKDGEPVSFCMVDTDSVNLLSDGKNKVASIGCVGTLPQYRRQGIGLYMFASAAAQCREKGCDSVFIHYTPYDRWYGKLGAVPVLKVWKCSIDLPEWKVGVEERT